jgi:hypothetical protein
MAFVNLPPNFQDMFYSITDRIAKLETGPNQAMYTAEYAQSVAESAQGGSLTAQTTAAEALAQSTIAQAQATSAQAAAASANTTASTALAQSTIAQAQAVSAQATAAAANTTASTSLAQSTIAQAQAVTAQATASAANTTASLSLAQSTIAQAQATSAQALASSANTNASTASAQATAASAQAVTAEATANTAMLQATVATQLSIQASIQANQAASQATMAQATANIANTNATLAQTTADGKNAVIYSTSAPGTTANKIGDIWYQYGTSGTYANKVIAQFSGAGGTSWTPVTVSGLIIANIDAGAITTGTLSAITITAGSGGNAFNVSSTGVMSAQGAWIKGNITADSGTFNGQVNATSGYFGSPTNGWQINAGGIAGLGSGYVSGGTIQGTNFNNGNGTFFVNSAGAMVAQSVYAQGVIRATSGFFGTPSSGWQIDSNGITGIGSGYVAGGTIQGTTFNNGNGTFYVSPAGALVAQSVFAQGVVRATSGYFGNGTNGWQIDSNGITGLGSGYIAGGAIQGTSFNNGNGTFFVNSSGQLVAQSVFAQGVIRATSGYFGTSTNGWQIDSNGITGLGSGYIAGGAIQGTSFNNGNGTFFVNSAGAVVAQSIYAKGAILGTSGYFGSATNGWQIDSNGITGIGSGYIAGGAIQGTSFNNGNGTFFVNAAGSLVAQNVYVKGAVLGTSGYFGNASNGWQIDSSGITGIGSGYIAGGAIQGTTVTGGIVQTSTGSSAVSMVGSNNSLTFKNAGTNVGHILPLSSNGVLTHYGATADSSGGTFPQMYVGSSNVSMFASSTIGIGIATGTGVSINGNTALNNQTTYPGVATGAGTSMVVVTTGSRVAIVTSSERFKEQVKYISTTGWLDKVMQMKPITYKTSEDFTTEGEPNETQIGFLAEDIYDIGGDLEKAVILDPLGDPFSLAYDRLTVFLMLAIKELKAEIDTLKQNTANL